MEIQETKKEQETITEEAHAPFYSSWKSILFTTHHTDIGILYLTFAFFFFFLGGASSMLVRYGLTSEGAIGPEAYAGLFTLHGVSMLFLFIITN